MNNSGLIQKVESRRLLDISTSLRSFGAYALNNEVEYQESGIPFIRGVNMKNGIITFDNTLYINEYAHNLLFKSEVFPEDILLSMSGTIGDVGIALPEWQYPINSNQDIAKITINKNIVSPYYVYAFLRSKYGQNYLQREARGSVQQHVFLSQMENFKIPLMSEEFVIRVEQVVKAGLSAYESSKSLYRDAEQSIMEELGFVDYVESNEVFSTKSFSESFGVSGRFDAEYYQKKYDDYEIMIKSYGEYTTIEDEFELVKDKCLFDNDVYNYTEIGDISVGNGKFSYTAIATDELPANAKTPVKVGDVLVSKVRPNRGAVSIIDSEIDNHIVSGAFTVLRAKGLYKKELLFVLLRTEIYKDWLLKYNVGTSYPTIKDEDVMRVKIPILPEEMQLKIINYVESSNNLIDEANKLLAKATQMVETAIECGEVEALK